ncbi:MAG TPA: D-alanyl-D-alanine carboxypeptidase [Waddliaceae bacterium]
MKTSVYWKLIYRSWFCLCCNNIEAKPLHFSVAAESAILMNADSGAILYEKNGGMLQYPASTTKIATVSYALVARENELNKEVVADYDALMTITDAELERANYNPPYRLVPRHTHMGIKRGEVLTLRDLLYGTILVSACDASNVIAKEIGGTISEFMVKLNEYLRSIGCVSTTLKNPHGLHHPEQKTTAYDLAIMTRIAMQNPTFRQIVKTVRYMRPETNKQKSSNLVQINKLLKPGKFYYPKAIGVKSGYFSIAKSNLVAAAESNGRVLIAVLMKAEERNDNFQDAIKMFEAAFAEKKIRKTLLSAGTQEASLLLKGAANPITTYLKSDITFEYYPSEEPQIRCFLEWKDAKLPISKDQVVGSLHFKDINGITLFTHSLHAQQEVKLTWSAKLLDWVRNHRLSALAIGIVIIATIIIIRLTRRVAN